MQGDIAVNSSLVKAISLILLGMKKPIHILQRGYQINSIVDMSTMGVLDA